MRKYSGNQLFQPFLLIIIVLILAFPFLYLLLSMSSSVDKMKLCEVQIPINEESFNGEKNLFPVSMTQIMSGNPITLAQDDERIIDYIWSHRFILPPSKKEYNLESPGKDPSMAQSQYILKLLNNMTNGIFVECGGLDGEKHSNTLFMEVHLGWKGLLVEGDPSNFALLTDKNRKCWTTNTCLAIKPYPHNATYRKHFNLGKIATADVEKRSKNRN